jgi:hypothetical protein
MEAGALVLALLWALSVGLASGAAFRLSFLNDGRVLQDTCQLLKQTGFSEEAVVTFQKLVEHHNNKCSRVDTAKFPVPEMGYYQFQNLNDLTDRLPGIFADTPAKNGSACLMCFDITCLLLRGAGYEAPYLTNDFASKAVVLVGPDGSTKAVGYDAFRSENRLLFPEQGYESLVGRPRSEAETRLGLSLRAARGLAKGDLTRKEGIAAAFAEYVAALKRDGFAFPRGVRLGLGLFVNSEQRYIVGDHAFLCIPKSGSLICLEKNGPQGPYVRVEFDSEADLADFVSWSLLRDAVNPKKTHYGDTILVSLNERLIGIFHSGTRP